MRRKTLLLMLLVAAFCLLFAVGVCAATTNEFGTPEPINGIDLTNMNTDTTSRVVIVDANGEYHTYPAQYVVSNNTKFYYDFKPINDALGTSYNKHSVIRIEVPDNILIATNCGDLSQTNNLVEIKFSPSSELHTLEYGCFYANKKLEKVNIPPKVTTMGTLIINNSTLKELVFMDGFSAVLPKDSFRGASGVQRVVFSNQMTTVEDRALDSTLGESLREFRFGASLKDLGTNNMAWVKQSVKFYMPEQFLSETDTITMETFSWWDSAACLPTGVIFFCGSLEQMQELIDKSTYDRVICSSANLVEWDSSKTDDEYVPKSGWTIVYNYNKCRAFYNNEHDEKQLNGCQFGCARECGVVDLLENPNHTFLKTVLYGNSKDVNYFSTISVCTLCENCKAQDGEAIVIEPLFDDKGYSVCLDKVGIVYGFYINKDAVADYKQYVSSEFEYGLVASSTEGDLLGIDGQNKVTPNGSAVCAAIDDPAYKLLEIKVVGISEENVDTAIVCCGYVRDGDSIYYLSEGMTSALAKGKTYNGLKGE